MAPLSGLSNAWVEASIALPLGWESLGVAKGLRVADPRVEGEGWVALVRRPEVHAFDKAKGEGVSADRVLGALANLGFETLNIEGPGAIRSRPSTA